ncbi:hypothetical protein DVR12_02650 [Chitinophaga silvatica]|uniref:Uncharacterized protein n=2 Tax=Chitinophaga silvatica TaxID=2282649 RepID=A0A3E1YH04_9BACT|nr:hypothetical protein DVR12_02650 [Chitinophaga silvatica]
MLLNQLQKLLQQRVIIFFVVDIFLQLKVNNFIIMEMKITKVKNGLSQQEITLTIDKKFDNLDPKDFAPKKLEAANKALPKMVNIICK